MRSLVIFVVVLAAGGFAGTTPAWSQVQSRPTDAPLVTADREPWYVNGDPVQFAGSTYFRAGAAVFFDGNRMVRTGSFNGVPLYADTTIEPFSVVLVPIGRGLMQPYEHPRSGDLAGTVGSQAPSFPVAALPSGWTPPMAPSAPTSLSPLVFDQPDASAASSSDRAVPAAAPAATTGGAGPIAAPAARVPLTPAELQAVRERVWIDFRGQQWVPAGPAIPLAGSGLTRTGDYAGFPVYTRADNQSDARIYVPALPGLVTPYERKR
jgi:hypothetical protein